MFRLEISEGENLSAVTTEVMVIIGIFKKVHLVNENSGTVEDNSDFLP